MKRSCAGPPFRLMWKTLLRRKGSSFALIAAMLVAVLASIILCGLQARQEAAMADMVRNTQI